MRVSESGGAPLILDDALGNTDPDRLKLMGAVLAKAGKECQIIILTCVPERYSNVGEATEKPEHSRAICTNNSIEYVTVCHNSCGVAGQCPGTEQSEDALRLNSIR